MVKPDQIVVVTGASGFIGSHIAYKLLESGATVRLVARGQKAERLRNTVAKKYATAQVYTITDIASDSLAPVLQGAYAVIHTAAPLAGRADAKTSLTSSVDGALNVLKQAHEHGVKKVVLTATWANVLEPGDPTEYWTGKVLTPNDWGHVTAEEVLSEGDKRHPFWVYCATKLLSERASWKFAEEKNFDLATINPPFVYGPFAPGFPAIPLPEIGANYLLYQLIVGEKDREFPPQGAPYYSDVRDVAEAHIRALEVPPAPKDPLSKRFLMASGRFLQQDVVKLLQEKRPALKDRLPQLEKAPPAPGPFTTTDTSRVAEVLKIKNPIVPWQTTVLETFDTVLKVEQESATA